MLILAKVFVKLVILNIWNLVCESLGPQETNCHVVHSHRVASCAPAIYIFSVQIM